MIGECRPAFRVTGAAPEISLRAFHAAHGFPALRACDSVFRWCDGCGLGALQKLPQIDFLLREKVLDGDAAIADPIQIVFPPRCDIWKEDLVGQYLAEGYAEFGRDEMLLLQAYVLPLLQHFDDGGACRLRADARTLFETIFQIFVLDILVNFLHCL